MTLQEMLDVLILFTFVIKSIKKSDTSPLSVVTQTK